MKKSEKGVLNMTENKPVSIISDSPEKDKTLFGFEAYANTIAGLIANKENKTPIVIGIYGPWGSGKTTLMETVKSFLDNKKFKDKSLYRICKTVWFQAWKYGSEDEILAALIEEIFKTMKRDGFFEACKARIEELVKKIKPSKLFGKLTELSTGLEITEFFSELEYKEKLGFYDTFQDFFDRLLWDYLAWYPKVHQSQKPDDSKAALVIFIDDLDRCPSEKILKVLETIKLFMDKEGCIFVIGAANEIIEKALQETYKEDAGKFMDKIVQVTFNLPQIPEKDFELFVEKVNPEIKDDISPFLTLIIPAMQNNPRQLKRFLNNLNLHQGLLKDKGVEIDFNLILFWNIINYIYPMLKKDIEDNPENLFVLKEKINDIEKAITDRKRWEIPSVELDKVPQSFQSYVQKRDLVEIVGKFDCTREQLHQLITLGKIIERVEERKEKIEDLPAFDKMVKVPAGEFLYGDDRTKENIEKAFFVDVYPATNAQYEKFIRAGGYNNDKYWSKEGEKWRQENNIMQPEYWSDSKWNLPDHPVVGVSYYEAEAYANWAGKRLPTEKEWEKAARGTDGREYPWGNVFGEDKCNSEESKIKKTTRVTRYPDGISIYGCYDMAGNVWEWTDSKYDKEKSRVVLCGGCWLYGRGSLRCSSRVGSNPVDQDSVIGFRCVRT